LWSVFAPLESAATASGTVQVENFRKTVQHLEGGIVRDILVKDGDRVYASQVLIRFDDTKARTNHRAIEGELWDAYARKARLLSERDGLDEIVVPSDLKTEAAPEMMLAVAGQQKIFETRRTLLRSKSDLLRQRVKETDNEIAGLQAQADALQRRLGFIHEEIDDAQKLMDRGLERKPRLLQLLREMADMDGQRGQVRAQIARAKETIAESNLSIVNLQNDSQTEVAQQLRETEQKIHELEQKRQDAADVLERIDVRAPIDGIVTDLHVHTVGGVVASGEALLDLVPQQDRVVVSAHLRPEDIDLVQTGLPAMVRLIPYKQRETPPIDSTVIYVSPDRLVDKATNQPYYEVKVHVSEERLAQLGNVEMKPGMPAEVTIKTGKTTVALYALSPILGTLHGAFREK
jgi:HlyD family secretion protein